MIFRSACCCGCRTRRRRTRIAIAALTLIAVAALAHHHAQPARTRPAPAPAPAKHSKTAHTQAAVKPPARSPSADKPPPSSPGTLAAAGRDLNWTGFHGIQLPISPSAGPRRTRGGLASGFTDTPQGALLAAINIGVRTSALWGTAIFRPTITGQVTGPDAAALLRAETSAYSQLAAARHLRAGQPTGRGYAVEAAYRFVAWTPESATVDVVTAGPGSRGSTVLASTRIQVVWLGGDWRVVAPPGGDWGSAAAAVSSLTGYTIFPGER